MLRESGGGLVGVVASDEGVLENVKSDDRDDVDSNEELGMLAEEGVVRRRGGIVLGRPQSFNVETIRVSNLPSKRRDSTEACWFGTSAFTLFSPSFLVNWRNESIIASVTVLCKSECQGKA
jgi:hypothetical protein